MSPPAPDQGYTSSVSRRDFLRVGGLGVVSLSVGEKSSGAASSAAIAGKNVIFLLMSGGPSHIETFDPKPEAPTYIRGPVKAISTALPGVYLSEGLPRIAERLDRCTLIRSLWHHAAPLHETSMQLLMTGRLAGRGVRPPSYQTVFTREYRLTSQELGLSSSGFPTVVLSPPTKPEPHRATFYRGETGGDWGNDFTPHHEVLACEGSRFEHEVLQNEPEILRRLYGYSHCGAMCLRARQLIEQGSRCVTVHLYPPQPKALSWDCHGSESSAPGIVTDYRDTICPEFDRAYAALIDDLDQRGLLDKTLVIATGEFGRSPRINPQGGREHWPRVWSAILAGGNLPEGRVVGASDSQAAEPIDRPVHISELVASIYHQFNVDPTRQWTTPTGSSLALVDASPIAELNA
ncbi:MAG: DUF1501 domain-containing protein [Planctomycetota bacterium]|nr:DUF1501 domain-containing protein [Planctomycetota bacterium]